MTKLRNWFIFLLLVVVFVAALLAAVDNSDEVTLKFLDYETASLPVSWWILIAFVSGMLFSAVLNMVARIRDTMRVRSANRLAAKRAQELDEARSSSITSPSETSPSEQAGT